MPTEFDTQSILSDVSVVIPTNRDEVHTLDTVPDECDVHVRRDNGLNIARNQGVKNAENEWIVLCDDDIDFPSDLVARLVDGMHNRELVGLNDFAPFSWIIGRFMVFHKSLWRAAGGFDDSRPHGGDTDFAIRCEKVGADVLALPRRILPHHDTDSVFTTTQHIEWLSYLFRNHPRKIYPPLLRLIASKLGVYETGPEYPEEWSGVSFSNSKVPTDK